MASQCRRLACSSLRPHVTSARRMPTVKAALGTATTRLTGKYNATFLSPVEFTVRAASFVARSPPLHGSTAWQVHKFGGASLGDAKKMKACGDLLIREARGDGNYAPTAAIVSAMKGMTSEFVDMVNFATQAGGEAEAIQKLDAIVHRQVTTVRELVGAARPDIAEQIIQKIDSDRSILVTMLQSFTHLHEVPVSAMAYVAGTGEIWSAQTLCGYLESKDVPTQWLNARDVLIVESDDTGLGSKGGAVESNVTPLYEETANKLKQWWKTDGKRLHDGDPIMVITGFVASTPTGVCTTLKRSGSDFSATIFAYLLKASRVTLWKEVDGIFTTDPFRVPSAAPLCSLSYEEALEIAYFGGEVLHPAATLPCMLDNIPIYVRNFLNPDFAGTVISSESKKGINPLGLVKGITFIEKIAMVNLDGAGWATVPILTQKAMQAMGQAGIKVVLVSQNSSRHSLSFAIDEGEADRAKTAMIKAFELELLHSNIGGVDVQRGFSMLSVVSSSGLKDKAGIAAPFFNALAKNHCNLFAIAQSSSGLTLSVVLAKEELSRAVQVVHASYEPMSRDMSVCVLGCGTVGGELLKAIQQYQNRDQHRRTIQEVDPVGVRVLAVADSKNMLLHETGLSLENMSESFGREIEKGAEFSTVDLDSLTDFMVRKAPNAVMVDCTGSGALASQYAKWLQRGIHVVSANKKASCAEYDIYCRNFNAARKGESRWLYEASVGSGLVISTIQDLLGTGDTIRRIEGIFSGTLSYIFNNLRSGKAFSEAVAEAIAMGYTERDPRDDLAGTDVQRKIVIIAREAGLELNLEDVHVESLVPEPLRNWQCPEGENLASAFVEALKEFDDEMALELASSSLSSVAEPGAGGGPQILRYVGIVDVAKGTAKVELRHYPTDHPFAGMRDVDNICLFSTERFTPQPLMVRGPGTGRSLISGGVFADLLRLGAVARHR